MNIGALFAPADFMLLRRIQEINLMTIYKYAMHTFYIRICSLFILLKL